MILYLSQLLVAIIIFIMVCVYCKNCFIITLLSSWQNVISSPNK